jgi:hypothetical protein
MDVISSWGETHIQGRMDREVAGELDIAGLRVERIRIE